MADKKRSAKPKQPTTKPAAQAPKQPLPKPAKQRTPKLPQVVGGPASKRTEPTVKLTEQIEGPGTVVVEGTEAVAMTFHAERPARSTAQCATCRCGKPDGAWWCRLLRWLGFRA